MNTSLHTQFPSRARRWAGLSAVLGAFLAMIEIPLYFVVPACEESVCGTDHGSLMPDELILTRTLLSFLALTGILVFMTGIRYLIAERDARYEWFGAVAGTAGVAWTIVDLTAKGLEGSTAIRTEEWIDPTRVVPTYLLYGAISHIMLAVFAAAFGYAVLKTSVLPKWVGWSAMGVLVLQVALIPTMFLGYNSSEFFAANGWGSVATFNGLTVLWIGVVGLVVMRRPRTLTP